MQPPRPTEARDIGAAATEGRSTTLDECPSSTDSGALCRSPTLDVATQAHCCNILGRANAGSLCPNVVLAKKKATESASDPVSTSERKTGVKHAEVITTRLLQDEHGWLRLAG